MSNSKPPPDKPASKAALPSKIWNAQVGTVLVLAGALVLFIVVYIPNQIDFLKERDSRQLGDMSSHTVEAISTLNSSVLYALTSTNDLKGAIQEILPPVTLEPKVLNAGAPDFHCVGISNQWNGTAQLLVLSYTNSVTSKSASIAVKLDDLLRPILSRFEFSDVLLQSSEGDVIFQLSQSGERATNAAVGGDLRIVKLPLFEVAGTNASTATATAAREMTLAGRPYKLFAQPVTITLGNDARFNGWLCGLILSRDFQIQSWQVPSTVTISFIFVALSVVLLWPFLNVVFAGPVDTLTRFEVAWVLGSGFIGCAALAAAVLYSGCYLASERRSNEQLNSLAENVETKLTAELSEMSAFLTNLDTTLWVEATKACEQLHPQDWRKVRSQSEIFRGIDKLTNSPFLEVFWLDTNGLQVAKWTPRKQVTPFVPAGDRPYFQTIRDHSALPLSNLKQPSSAQFYLESIFSKTRGRNLAAFSQTFSRTDWPCDYPSPNPFVAFPLATVVTFEPLSLFSPVLPAGYGFCLVESSGKVLFHSDGRQNLRENFLVESGRERRLESALFTRSASSFDARYLDSDYHVSIRPVRGTPWSIVAFRDERPLQRVHRNVLLSASCLFGFYLLMLLILFALALFTGRRCMERVREQGWFWWLWPISAENRYGRRALFVGCVVIAAFAAVCFGRKPQHWLGCGLLPSLACTALLLWRRRFARQPAGEHRTTHKTTIGKSRREPKVFQPWAYELYLAFLFAFLAIVPAIACYRTAFANEMESYVKGTQLQLARDLQARKTALRAELHRRQANGVDATYSNALYEYRRATPRNRYFEFLWDTHVSDSQLQAKVRSDEPAWLGRLYESCRPNFRDTLASAEGLLAARATDASWQSDWEGQRLLLRLPDPWQAGDDMTFSSVVPPLSCWNVWPFARFESETAVDCAWYLLLLAVVAGPFLFSGFVTRQVLLLTLPANVRSPYYGYRRHIPKPFDGVWNGFKPEEKLALYQIATTGFCNPKCRVLLDLLEPGPIRFGPRFAVGQSRVQKLCAKGV
jgi:hypothetical protein